MKIDPNAPAFPLDYCPEGMTWNQVRGLTIRAEIAARVLAGMVDMTGDAMHASTYAEASVKLADALIAELNREAV